MSTETRTPVSLIARSLENASRAELDQVRKDWLLTAYSNGTFTRLETLANVYGKPLLNTLRHEYIHEIAIPLYPDRADSKNVYLYYQAKLGGFVPHLESPDLVRSWSIVVSEHMEYDQFGVPKIRSNSGRLVCSYTHYKSLSGISYKDGPGGYDYFIVPGPWLDRLLDYSTQAQSVVDAEAAAKEEEARNKLYKTLCIDLLL